MGTNNNLQEGGLEKFLKNIDLQIKATFCYLS